MSGPLLYERSRPRPSCLLKCIPQASGVRCDSCPLLDAGCQRRTWASVLQLVRTWKAEHWGACPREPSSSSFHRARICLVQRKEELPKHVYNLCGFKKMCLRKLHWYDFRVCGHAP